MVTLVFFVPSPRILGSCEPYPRSSRLLFCMFRTQLLMASSLHVCCWILVCPTLVPLNELLNWSCKCAAARDDVASIRIHNCNTALTVNFACAGQSFVNIDFPATENHSIPIFSRSLHAQATPDGNEFTRSCFCSSTHSPAFPCQTLHPAEMLKLPHSCGLSIKPNLRDPGADPLGVADDAKSRELARAGCGCWSATATCSPCPNEPAPLPVKFFCLPSTAA